MSELWSSSWCLAVVACALAGHFILISRDKKWVTLEEYLGHFKKMLIPTSLPGRPEPLHIAVVDHLNGPVGGKMFVEIVHLRGSILGKDTSLSAQAWCTSWMGWWQKKLRKCGLDPSFHLRRSSAGKAQHGQPASLWQGIDFCKHPQPLMSSVAFMILLQQWCTPSRQKKDEVQLEAWRGLRRGLLERLLPEAASFTLYDDEHVAFCSGGLWGESARAASIEKGRLIVREPESCSEMFMLAVGSSEDNGRKIETLLDELSNMGATGLWMLKQLAFHLATFLEATTAAASEPQQDSGLEVQRAGRTRRRRIKNKFRTKQALTPRPHTSSTSSKNLLQYLSGAREHFKAHASLTVASDGCRSGCRNRMNAWVASSDNVGAWAPPIVLGSLCLCPSPQ